MPISNEQPGHGSCDHTVRFYDDEDQLTDEVGRFASGALSSGGAALIVATPEHCSAFVASLQSRGHVTARCAAEGSLTIVDASESLDHFLGADGVDWAAFERWFGDLLLRIGARERPLRIYGEMVSLLWDRGQVNEAIQLEEMWNKLRAQMPFELLCSYPTASVASGDVEHFWDVCRLHSEVRPRWPLAEPSAGLGLAPRQATLQVLPRNEDSPGAARRFVEGALSGWASAELVEDASLVVTELATNALVHARSEITVSVIGGEDLIRLAVSDASHSPPVMRPSPPVDPGGRGLAMVAAVADCWGAHPTADGKTVWAELRR